MSIIVGVEQLFKKILEEVKKARCQFYTAHFHEKEKFLQNEFIELDNFALFSSQ